MRPDVRDKNVHIIGMARSGLAAAEVLTSLGAKVTIHDHKPGEDLNDALAEARKLGASTMLGEHAYSGVTDADFVVVSPGVPESCPGLKAAREAVIPVLPEIELAYRISSAPIIAVTGTNGKTTTTALIGEIIRFSGKNVFVAGNIVAGELRLPLVLAASQASVSDVIVAEISSFQLEWITSFRPRVAALLNVTADHLDRYSGIEQYARAKARVFEFQQPDDSAVLNADDPRVVGISAGVNARIWWFSRTGEVKQGAFVRGTEVWARTSSGEQVLCDISRTKLRGAHNVENILAAAAASAAYGVEPRFIQEGVDAIEPPEHRLEPVGELRGVEFLNNSMCTNVAAAVCSLQAIGRPAVIIAGGKDKGSNYAPLGQAFAKYAKHVVLIGQDAPLLESAALDAGFTRITRADSMEQAVETAWRQAEPGDSVVLSPACASFDMFADFEHRGRAFKEAVLDLMERMGE